MANKTLAKKIYSKQNEIVREINNAHIFLEQVSPLLADARDVYAKSKTKKDKKYYVPSAKTSRYAMRTDKELQEIYKHYMERGLFEVFLVDLVAKFEWFLSDVFVEFFSHYPKRMLGSFKDIPNIGKIELSSVIDANGKDDLVKKVIFGYVGGILRQRPDVYMPYASSLFDMDKNKKFDNYYEICATRDLIVHGSGVINDIYLKKAGKKSRGNLGGHIKVDEEYFSKCVATLKQVSGQIKAAFEVKFGGPTTKKN